ncbi:hypothetical protein COCOBI_13-3800 [Coccomyxa sp. Obi]|nr:hypothetical protein COCOBI_13-3800 [Coccomyxa sp. Obi]
MAQPDTFKPWVWAVFAFNTLFNGIFAILCFATFSSFRKMMNDTSFAFPAGTDRNTWQWLFDGAAVNAFFALILVVLSVAFAIRYMIFSRRALSHPRSSYGKGIMVATSLFAALHMINIATQFLSFEPAMTHWVRDYHAHFNRVLLMATVAFGYISAAMQLLFLFMLLVWHNREAEALDRVALAHSEA